jgi:hypothetical protein
MPAQIALRFDDASYPPGAVAAPRHRAVSCRDNYPPEQARRLNLSYVNGTPAEIDAGCSLEQRQADRSKQRAVWKAISHIP